MDTDLFIQAFAHHAKTGASVHTAYWELPDSHNIIVPDSLDKYSERHVNYIISLV